MFELSEVTYEEVSEQGDSILVRVIASSSYRGFELSGLYCNSIEKNGLRYVNYIGDGDSSAFKKVHESNPYPGKPVEKLECVGHIQKRVGAGLMTLRRLLVIKCTICKF